MFSRTPATLSPLNFVLAGILLCGVPALAVAQGEHSRRAAAELLVLRGDLNRIALPGIPERHQKGLRDRVMGSLSGLGLLLRMADAEQGRSPVADPAPELRALFLAGDTDSINDKLNDLVVRYPFFGTGILPAAPSAGRLETGQRLHASMCLGCHDIGLPDNERPARDLFEQSAGESLDLFAARMVIGVRGDRLTGIDNPLTDEEIASLIAYYRSGGKR